MRRLSASALYLAAMVITIVGVDLLLFKNHFGPRLIANVLIVLVFAAFYRTFLRLR